MKNLLRFLSFVGLLLCFNSSAQAQSYSATIVSEDFWGPTTGTVTVTAVEWDAVGNRVRFNLVAKPWSGASGWSGAWGALYDIRAVLRSADGNVNETLTTIGNTAWLPATAGKNPYTLTLQGYWSMAGWVGNTLGKTTFSVSPTVKKVNIALRNTSDAPRSYEFWQNGVKIGGVTLQPGEAVAGTMNATGTGDVVVKAVIRDAVFQDGVWVAAVGTNSTVDMGTVTPVAVGGGDTVPPTNVEDAAGLPSKTDAGSQAAKDSKAIWNPVEKNTDPDAQIDLLTNEVYREGVEKQRQAVADAEETRKNEILAANTKAESDLASANSQSTTKQSAVKDLINSQSGMSKITGTKPSTPSGSDSMFTIELMGITFNLDPENQPAVKSGASFFKLIIQWISTIIYSWWVLSEIQNFIKWQAVVPQAKGNQIAGTGGQGFALIAAGLLVGVLFLSVPAIWTILETGPYGVAGLWDATSELVSDGSSIAAGVWYLLNFFFPVVFLMTLAAHVFLFRKLAIGLHAATFVAIKFIVP